MHRVISSSTFSRRRWLAAAGLSAFQLAAQNKPLTARDVINRIKQNVGVPWEEKTVDTFKAGNPDTTVRGIATSFGGTLDVLERAAAAGRNLIIVHEPTFYNHEDRTDGLSGAVFERKQKVIRDNDLVVWRFHDHWHRRRPDGILTGLVDALGWDKYQDPSSPRLFVLPPAPLRAVARSVRDRLSIRTMRVIGNPELQISRIAVSPGYTNGPAVIRWLERDNVDALIIGECREWEGIEYARDAMTAGHKKSLIILGHVPSEESGMKECARWLKTFIPEVPIDFLPSREPFWAP